MKWGAKASMSDRLVVPSLSMSGGHALVPQARLGLVTMNVSAVVVKPSQSPSPAGVLQTVYTTVLSDRVHDCKLMTLLVALSLPLFGSNSSPVTVAVLLMMPLRVSVMLIKTVAIDPLASVPRLHVTVADTCVQLP